MTWFMVDDNLALHQKVVAAGNEAMGLWVRAGSWCGQHLTDGFIPEHVVKLLGTRRQADKLVTVGLWRVVDGGWAFHEWAEKQQSREEVEAKREARAAAGRLGGKASGQSRRAKAGRAPRSNDEASASQSVEPPSLPSPTYPVVPSELLTAAAAAVGPQPPPQPVDNPAATDLPNSLVILRAALEARKLIVRWDRLTSEHVTAIDALITTHGDERLVHAAMQAHRPDRPAAFAQAWIGVWQSLPNPGSRLRVVRARCEKPGHEHEDAQHCRACASEGKAKEAHA